MELQSVIQALFDDSKNTPLRALKGIAEAERYLQQAYEGRYFFELIQNVRDANKEANQDGSVFIHLTESLLSISNTGAEFSKEGVESITTIGSSPKRSQKLIGFKGIGFKSIQEVTNSPCIVTKRGSIEFDRRATLSYYQDSKLKERDLPLFYFPHFRPLTLSPEELQKGVVTKIALPLRSNISTQKIEADFKQIGSQQLLLLGSIKELLFQSPNESIRFAIEADVQKHGLTIRKNDEAQYYKIFHPQKPYHVTDDIVAELEDAEQEIISGQRDIEVALAFETNEKGQFMPMSKAQLYLFYPLKINSGFRFIIHGYFLVNPERTGLRRNRYNTALLQHIGRFIATDWLITLKDVQRANVTNVLCFQRTNEDLSELYDAVVSGLSHQKFIYDQQTRKFYKPSEVIIADGFDKDLFPDGKLDDRQIIFCRDKEVRDWLTSEFDIPYISYSKIADVIEAECRKQAKRKNIPYFQKLYNYILDHPQLHVADKQIFYTTTGKLVNSNEDVFYGGRRQKDIQFPLSIQKHIHFIHNGITIRDFKEGKSKTGIVVYSTFELVRRLCKLFKTEFKDKQDILHVLLQLELDSKSRQEIREKILVPVMGSEEWISPITTPVYFPTPELKQLYPKGKFIDLQKIGQTTQNVHKVTELMKLAGVWQIPGVYVKDTAVKVSRFTARGKLLFSRLNLYSDPFWVQNDRVLDVPQQPNKWFCDTIIENWQHYKEFMKADWLPKMKAKSNSSDYRDLAAQDYFLLSGFAEGLRVTAWIFLPGHEVPLLTSEIVGIEPSEFRQPHMQVVKRLLNILPVPYSVKGDFISVLNIMHLTGDSYENYRNLLQHVYTQYKNDERVQTKEFVDFYNRLLSKLFDFHAYRTTHNEGIKGFKQQHLLAINEQTGVHEWIQGGYIYYLDDKPYYDQLPESIKAVLQPHFTNRDRNTVGRVAALIGKKVSTSISKTLLEEASFTREQRIQNYFPLLPQIIALLETHLNTALTEHFETIRQTLVREKSTLEVQIQIEKNEPITLQAPYFISYEKYYCIHIWERVRYSPETTRETANALNDFFSDLLDKDTQKFNLKLNDYLRRRDKEDFLSQYEVSEYRISEIQNALNNTELNERQQFWYNVVSAKSHLLNDALFEGTGVDCRQLGVLFNSSEELISRINECLDFNELSNPDNIPHLKSLFSTLSLSLRELNDYQVPRIDFSSYYIKEFNKIKNLHERRFECWLFQYLQTQGIGEKRKFQTYLDTYKHGLSLDTEDFTLEQNPDEEFANAVRSSFPFCDFDSFSRQDPSAYNQINRHYHRALGALKKSLVQQNITAEHLEEFLTIHKHRSLLYFNNIAEVETSYKSWLSQKVRATGNSSSDASTQDISGYYNSADAQIDPITVCRPSIVHSNRQGGANLGRRLDGAQKNEEKKAHIGFVAESLVFDLLKRSYSEVQWVSRNAAKAGFPEGDDSLGYDIEYLDACGNKYFVEVKGKAGFEREFEITSNELQAAMDKGTFYKVIFVTNTLNNDSRRFEDLGNLFLFKPGESLFDNQDFEVHFNSLEIHFKKKDAPVV